MSSNKPRSVREILMNAPPPSKSVQDDRILREMNKLVERKLVQKAPVQAQPKPTIAQIIRRNSLKEAEKRKIDSKNGPLSEIDASSDRLTAPVKKFKKPSCRPSTASSVAASSVVSPSLASSTSAPNSASSASLVPPNKSAKVSPILTQDLTRRGSEPKKSPEKPKISPIDDILDSIFQSAEKTKPSLQSVTPPPLQSSISKHASPNSSVSHPPKPNSPSQSVSIPSKAIPHQSAISTPVASNVQESSGSALNTVPSAINGSSTALPPHHINPTGAIHAARPVAPWSPAKQPPAQLQAPAAITNQALPPHHLNQISAIHASTRPVALWSPVKQPPGHVQASVATTNQALPPHGVSPLPSPPLSAQQSSNSSVLASSAAAQSLHPRDKPKKISKNQQKKLRQAAKRAANAAKEHADNRFSNSNNLEDADFDTLLQLHEKSTSAKPADQPMGNNAKQNKNAKKNKNKNKQKNKASDPQVDSNLNQHIQNQATHNSNAVNRQVGTVPQLGNSQLVNQASNQQQDTGSISSTPTPTSNNSKKPTLEDVARQITGAPKPMKRPNDTKATQQNKRQKTKKEFVPLVTCRFFANGHCSNGDACTFKHDKDAVVVQDNPKKKIVCEFFKTGSCCKFDACPFSHDLKLEPCRFFHLNNNCKEANCPYSHDPLNDEMLAKLRKLTGPCRYYHFKGVCNQGDRCPFSHDDVDKAELEKVEASIHLCTFYHLDGACAKGDSCFYLHQEATAEQIAELKAKNKK